MCEQVVIAAPPERDDDRVFNSVLTAIWMSPREASARLKAHENDPRRRRQTTGAGSVRAA
jgi:hypothetical protein